MAKIKVGIVGYGTIGKRVADAVLKQPDMELVGITMRTYNYRYELAQEKGILIYVLDYNEEVGDKSIKVQGDLKDLCKKSDIIIDCSPGKKAVEHKKLYEELGVKHIFQGGEKSNCADVSFVACCNYDEAKNKDSVRVVSCNTTGLCRTLKALDELYEVESSRVTLIRRATDPGDVGKGPINAIIPTMQLPSHHGPDVNTVLPGIDIFTSAVVVPTTMMHLHCVSVKVKRTPHKDEIIKALKDKERIRLISTKEKITSTAHIMELAKDIGNGRGDMMEICIWKDSISVRDNEIFFTQAIHQESDVVPENIDAIRAMIGITDKDMSMKITNETLGISKRLKNGSEHSIRIFKSDGSSSNLIC